MFSPEINTNLLPNLHNSKLIPRLPAPLTAPLGWRSEIIDSNSPLPVNIGINTANYGGYHVTNTSGINQFSSGLARSNTAYGNGLVSYQQRPILVGQQQQQQQNVVNFVGHQHLPPMLTQQQQRNIVNIVEHQNPPPILVRKRLPNNEVTYKQHVSVRYLQPPTPPPPGPLIIREVRPPAPPPQPPIKIRQRPAPPPTPPPIVLRERPPPFPPSTPAKVVEKLLPPAAPAPPRVVIERFGACPPKPPDVVIERWLPYKQSGPRRVLLERAPAVEHATKEPNLLILHDSPQARIKQQFINEGVVCADPDSYLQRYGADVDSGYAKSQYAHVVGEATRAVPPPAVVSPTYEHRSSYVDEYRRSPSPYISNTWERTRVVSPIPRSYSYPHVSSYSDSYDHYCNRSPARYEYDRPSHYCNSYSHRYDYDVPSHYCNQSSSRYGYGSYRSYDDYPTYYDNYRSRSPSWNGYYHSSSYNPYYRSSSYYPSDTIRVHSEHEFHRVLSDLTNGHVPATLGSY